MNTISLPKPKVQDTKRVIQTRLSPLCCSAPSESANGGATPALLFLRELTVPEDVREFVKVAVEELADAFVVLQTKVIIVALGRRQVDEVVQRQRKAFAVQEVRGRQRREVKVGHVSQAGERVAPQEGFCGGKRKRQKTGGIPCDASLKV